MPRNDSPEHAARIADQFTRQAAGFAAAPELHNDAVLDLLVEAAQPKPSDIVVDLACGPGSVALAFAPHVARVEGLDATDAMLAQARSAAANRRATNVTWRSGSVYALPYEDASVDLVVSRFAMHHLEDPPAAIREMRRVAVPGARIVLCDGVAPDDPDKRRAFNEMERWRDPSTVEYRTLDYLVDLFRSHGLEAKLRSRFQVVYLARELVARSFPANDDRAGLLALIDRSVDADLLGMRATRTPAGTQIAFQSVVLVATKA
jgi:ubiquinone/menaquinone biosynthesis C-methylase UbiE